MRLSRGMAGALAAVLLLGIAAPAGAQHDRDEDRVEFTGVIIATDTHDQTIVVREERRRADRVWLVQIVPRTRIEIDRRWTDDAPGLGPGFGSGGPEGAAGRARFWLLRVGHTVEVEGRVVDGRRVIAREITVIGRVRPPFPRPPFAQLRPPQVFFPQDGAVVDRDDLVVVGDTVPRARVHVDLLASWPFFPVVVARAEVTADEGGIFVARLRPVDRVSAGTYRLAVRSTVGGVTSPTTTLVVRLR